MPQYFRGKHSGALALLTLLGLVFWGRVLFADQALLPGDMLRGFLPFGGDPAAPWTILQWDALAQYYPWRHYAAQELRAGQVPLWNPYQFTGAPFLANSQSAIFYPLNLPFWLLGTSYAFGVSAFLHSLLILFSTYFLGVRWGLSRAAAVLAAAGFAFSGYLVAWSLLPTLAATAAWLPLALLLLEKSAEDERPGLAWVGLVVVLTCALLAGHAQIFAYVLMALALRLVFLKRKLRGLLLLEGAFLTSLLLGAVQILPTLELARLGHRSSSPPWQFWQERAPTWAETVSFLVPAWPLQWGTLNENFGYVGSGLLLLALMGLVAQWSGRRAPAHADASGRARCKRGPAFAGALAAFGVLYALATPLAQVLYISVPGLAMMGGPGRALLLWSLGAALLAGLGVDLLRKNVPGLLVPALALLWVMAELVSNAWMVQPTAARSTIYPATELTTWLAQKSSREARVLFLTPRASWLPTEMLQPGGRNHPPGILPPNGAMVYRLHDINGYDSLAPRAYREWTQGLEGAGITPALNGNMVLFNNTASAELLDSLSVRYVVVPAGNPAPGTGGKLVLTANGCQVWERQPGNTASVTDGRSFYPGWRDGVYAPQSYQLGLFLSLCTLGALSSGLAFRLARRRESPPTS